jgi:hypothetical protein
MQSFEMLTHLVHIAAIKSTPQRPLVARLLDGEFKTMKKIPLRNRILWEELGNHKKNFREDNRCPCRHSRISRTLAERHARPLGQVAVFFSVKAAT